MTFTPRLNPAAKVQMRRIGNEHQPLLVIDDVILDAEEMVGQAVTANWGPPIGTYYPGLNAAFPASYLHTLGPVLRPSFARAFDLPLSLPMAAIGFFALATWPLEKFEPLQRIPHYDQTLPECLAMVHYLCKDQPAGTGFFRHTATGYESIDTTRRDGYVETVKHDIARDGGRLTGFAGPDTPNYEMIDMVEAKFNRLVIYRSNVLHCALFDGTNLTDDPRTGRLTANSFFSPDR